MAERHESCRGEVAARGHAGRQEPEPRPGAPADGEFRTRRCVTCNGLGCVTAMCPSCFGDGLQERRMYPLPSSQFADAVDGGEAR